MYEEITGESLADLPLIERLDRTDKAGLIYWPEKKGGTPRFKQYIDISLGQPLQDIIVDISAIPARAAERLGYPTQKPIALMERIVEASSSKGDVVLDPFCGCGTTIVAAERLDRRWVGIDVTNLAITLVKHRLIDTFGKDIEFETVGEPTSLPDAAALAAADRFQFQVWALGLIGARPDSPKKGADRGIDGVLYFHEPPAPETKQIVISVKSGKPKVTDVRDLASVVDREDAEIGVLITLQAPTGPMTREAATRGFYESAYGKHPKIQILTIEDLFDGKQIDRPPTFSADTTFSRAQKGKKQQGTNFPLFDE